MLAAGSSATSVDRIRIAIQQAAAKYGIDGRLILAIVMIESRGNVGVGHAYDGQNTNGLMQAMGCAMFEGQHDVSQVRAQQNP